MEKTTIKKRSGEEVDFNAEKIYRAVHRCLTQGKGIDHLEYTPELSGSVAQEITQRVLNILNGHANLATVEQVQDLVEQQLMAAGHFDAAKAYILYREERAKSRLARPTLSPEDADRLRVDRGYFGNSDIRYFQFADKYARWIEEKNRRETWPETVDRAIGFIQQEVGYSKLFPQEWIDLREALFNQDALCSMRLLQMAGPAATRCNAAIYNCSFIPIKDLRCFAELLYVLMQGCGAGFSVESEFVEDLPKIKKQKGGEVHRYVIEDADIGWCDALLFGLETWFNGEDVEFDDSLVRPAGAVLRTKGGRASGPEPLMDLLRYTRQVVLSRQGKRLRPIDCMDICDKEGDITQVGGVRRAALICLFDEDDVLIRRAKHGAFWQTHPHRGRSNNSIAFWEKPSEEGFLSSCWLPLMEGKSGEPGIFNREGILRKMPKRRSKLLTAALKWIGVNPCGEIALRMFGFCNLSICVARPGDTIEDLRRKVKIAAIFGTLQSTMTRFRYLRDEWKRNCEEERLLGVDINGWQDCELLRYGAPGRCELMEELRELAVQTNREWAERLGINPSAAVTCVKPSGNSSTLLACSAGLHPREGRFYIRRVRAGRYNPITKFLQESGMQWFPEVGQDAETCQTVVFEFLERAPDAALTYDDMTAEDQFFNWLEIRRNWTEHNPSCTIRVRDGEWLNLGALVYQHWDEVGGLSFMNLDDHVYQLAPYEKLTEEEYNRRLATFPEIQWEKLPYYEDGDQTGARTEMACTADGCML